MRKLVRRFGPPASLLLAISSLAFSAGESETSSSTGSAVSLVYTGLERTTQVMTRLPSIMEIHDVNLELNSWKGGNPCRPEMRENLRTMLIGGSQSDWAVYTHCDRELLDLGHFRSIPTRLITPELTPNIFGLLQTGAFDDYIEGDELVAVPGLSIFMILPTRLLLVREDLIEQLGYSFENDYRISLEPHEIVSFVDHDLTLDELYGLLMDIRSNPIVGTNPPVASGRWNLNWPTFFGAFGLSTIGTSEGTKVTQDGVPNTLDEESGVILPNVMTSQYRDLVRLAARWYSEGLIGSDVFVSNDDDDAVLQRMLKGEAAVVLSFPILRNWKSDIEQALRDGIISDSTRLIALPPPIGRDQGTHIWRTSEVNDSFMSIDSAASDDEVQLSLRILDYVKLTREGYILEHLGINAIARLQGRWDADDPESVDHHFPRYPYFRMPHMYPIMYRDTSVQLLDRLTSNGAWALKPSYWIGPRGSPEMREQYERIGESIGQAIDKNFTSMVTGKLSMEEFPDFIDQLKELGILDAFELVASDEHRVEPQGIPRWSRTPWAPIP